MRNILIIAVLLFAGNVFAADVEFSWLQNQDNITQEYEIYCDLESLGGGDGHALWKVAPMDNEIDGRVHYVWQDFPERETYYCVCVAKGISEGQMMVSDYSNELEVLITPAPVQPGTPQEIQFEIVIQGTITPVP